MKTDLSAKSDINDPGKPKSLQRLCYNAARVGWGPTWGSVNELAQNLLEKALEECPDTEFSLLLNALCCALEECVSKGEQK